jgi:hypothetical protein
MVWLSKQNVLARADEHRPGHDRAKRRRRRWCGCQYTRFSLNDPGGARNSATLRGLHVFVDGSAESVTPDDLVVGGVGVGSARSGAAWSRV